MRAFQALALIRQRQEPFVHSPMSTPPRDAPAPAYSLFSRDTLEDLATARREAEAGVAHATPGAREHLRACWAASQAVAASDAGQRDKAVSLLNDGLAGVRDVRLLFLAFQFFMRIGDYSSAERYARERLAACKPGSSDEARACTNIGLVHQVRFELDKAEEMHRRAIEIARASGDQRELARALGNLALVPEARAELDDAEALYHESLAIAERIGATDIVATKLANLGDIALTRGRRAEARALWKDARARFESLADAKGAAHCDALLAANP